MQIADVPDKIIIKNIATIQHYKIVYFFWKKLDRTAIKRKRNVEALWSL